MTSSNNGNESATANFGILPLLITVGSLLVALAGAFTFRSESTVVFVIFLGIAMVAVAAGVGLLVGRDRS
ncbi:hypothetical protein CH294_10835 [Rhodococcus sp. 14-2483-1-1]|uniref:hypothetical protein n=1 Tax=Rhodococcus sp. 14-2483-1-1 TaxID=2023148 RepID=UPI000B9BEE3E|nr:hypothetical protein [Rhodococcus sp. 14-2483-1-1]OZF36876.1 hypothetical protein CH294_10835 [Rhodococcus sp. 14-2483-1-1]